MTANYDVIIAGARCAGAATGMLLARKGVRVLMVDPRRPGADALSTHALMRPAIYQLKQWGLLDAVIASGAAPVRSTQIVYGKEVIDVPVSDRSGVDALYAPRRHVLDGLLVDAAERAGVDVRFGWKLEALLEDEGRVRGAVLRDERGARHRVTAPLVVGADGRTSKVAELVGAPVERSGKHHTVCMYAYYSGLSNQGYRWFYAEDQAGGIVPTNDGLSCVFVCVPSSSGFSTAERDAQIRNRIEQMAVGALTGAELASPVYSFAGARGFLRRPRGPGWALVGDAGYFKDPLTAHGITDALRDSELLTASVLSGDRELSTYHSIRDKLSHRFFTLTDAVASFDWDLPTLREMHLAINKEMKQELEELELARAMGRLGSGDRERLACA